MSAAGQELYREAIKQNIAMLKDALDEVNAARPFTRYPLARRLWWRVVGVPDDVRQARFREGRERESLYYSLLHARRLDRCT